MYPYLHDFFNDILGTHWRLPFPMFGFWVALAFVAAHYIFVLELKRKEGLGLVQAFQRKRMEGEKMSVQDGLMQALLGFLVGYKGLQAVLYYDAFVSDPPSFLFSSQGSVIGGLAMAAILFYWRYREVKKQEREVPLEVEESVHPFQLVGNMTLIAALAGILGAKLFHNLENIDEFMNDPLGALMSFSGLSIYGGLIIGGLAVIIYARKNGLKAIHVMDACAPGLILAYGVGRIGCQLAGDGDWGLPNDGPMPEFLSFLPDWMWSYNYPNNVLGVDLQQDFMRMGLVSETGRAWPTPFYESVMAFVIFAFLWSIRKRMSAPGLMFSLYILLAGVERFFIEKIRINPPYKFFGIEATQAEIISVLLIIAGLAGIYASRRKRPS